MSKYPQDILVVGSGVVGLSVAHALLKQGVKVTVIDQNDIYRGCSQGNTGLVVPSHITPLASPGMLKMGLAALIKRKGPLYLKMQWQSHFVSWLISFASYCRQSHVDRVAGPMFDLANLSRRAMDELTNKHSPTGDYRPVGAITVYRKNESLDRAAQTARQYRSLGLRSEYLDRKTLKKFEPCLDGKAVGGIYFPNDASIHPEFLGHILHQKIEALGGTIKTYSEVLDFVTEDSRVKRVVTTAGDIPCDYLVIAAGSNTTKLCHKLGVRVPIVPAKGMTATYQASNHGPRRSLLFEDEKVVMSRLGDSYRLGGILDLAGFDSKIHTPRIDQMLGSVEGYFARPFAASNERKTWQGFRPLTPSGVPLICQAGKWQNCAITSGHGMLGISLGPATGTVAADLILNQGKNFRDILQVTKLS